MQINFWNRNGREMLVKDLNPLSKLNIFIVLGLSAFFAGDYRYGFGMVILLFIVALAARCMKSYLKVYWKVLLLFGVFLFVIKAAFSPGEQIIWQKWGNPYFCRKHSGGACSDIRCTCLLWGQLSCLCRLQNGVI